MTPTVRTFIMISSCLVLHCCEAFTHTTFNFSIYGPLGRDAAEYIENILKFHTNVESLRYYWKSILYSFQYVDIIIIVCMNLSSLKRNRHLIDNMQYSEFILYITHTCLGVQ